jgi:hypothetical protein
MPGTSDPYAAFRLNLEQQRKRAKDLLRAVRAGDAAARRRLADAVALPVPDAVTIKLADAQFAIARELGFRTWRDLRTHVMAQAAAREAITQPGPAVDADMPTLHVRCGSDLWRVSQGELEPMPFLGDTMFLHILNQMGRAHPAVYERSVLDPERPFSDRLAITQTGRDVLQGVTDWLSLQPPLRWLGGVRIDPSTPNWRWDEARQDVTMA